VRKTKVLVIDDDPYIAELIKDHLEKGNFEVKTAYSGSKGLEIAEKYKPDIITLDILMPDMTGFQVAEILEKNKVTRDIPVVFVSVVNGLHKEVIEKQGKTLIPKPINFKRLLQIINKSIKQKLPHEVLISFLDSETADILLEFINKINYHGQIVEEKNFTDLVKREKFKVIIIGFKNETQLKNVISSIKNSPNENAKIILYLQMENLKQIIKGKEIVLEDVICVTAIEDIIKFLHTS